MASNNHFVGRNQELKQLLGTLRKKIANLIVIKGRKRVGKSRLIREFAKGYINRVFTWSIKTSKPGKLSRYYLKDNYLRF